VQASSVLEGAPADRVASDLVFEHQRSDLFGELVALPVTLGVSGAAVAGFAARAALIA
jgi:hypothetical protein